MSVRPGYIKAEKNRKQFWRWPALQFPRFHRLNLMALALVILTGFVVDRQFQRTAELNQRAAVQEQIGILQTRLQSNIFKNILLVRGLVAVLITEPGMSQQRFASLARHVMATDNQLRHIAAAPGMVIRMLYPLEGNEAALGLDLGANPGQFPAAEQARISRRATLAGPIDLVQGGVSMIARVPVFIPTAEGERFWGVVSAVINNNELYLESGLLDPDLPIDVALVGKNGLGASGEQFFGDSSVLANDPVTTTIALPNGTWQLAAVPRDGWGQGAFAIWSQRGALCILGLLVLIPIFVTDRLNQLSISSYQAIQAREEKLRQLSRRLELALDASNVGVWDCAVESNELFWDDQMRSLYGIDPDKTDVTVEDWQKSLHPLDAERAQREFADALANKSNYATDFRVVLPDGSIRHIRAKAALIEDTDGTTRIIGLNWDVTRDIELQMALEQTKSAVEERNAQLETAKKHIEHVALHDSLTGLPNRRYFDRRLLGRSEKGGDQIAKPNALLVIDIDHFKEINDGLGHVAGDILLRHLSEILQASARSGDFVARIGGDEFAIMCSDATERQHLMMLAQSIIAKCAQPVEVEGHACAFSVSIGIATDPKSGNGLMADADMALYEAKQAGRNRFEFFAPGQRTAALAKKSLADDIARGLDAGEFIPFYQTQHISRSGAVAGVEALVRWQHPEKGLLSPFQFLDVADQYGLTARIDHVILEHAIADMARWKADGFIVPRASVNLSAERMGQPELINLLETMDFEPGTLSFELLESIFMDDFDAVDLDVIERIKALGIEIEIDDFGTGYSSIIGLLKVNPSRLKIDRQLIAPMTESEGARKLVQSVIEIGHSLNIEVVAEGVESAKHIELLSAMGCDVLQGYVFSKPMPVKDLLSFIAEPSGKLAAGSTG